MKSSTHDEDTTQFFDAVAMSVPVEVQLGAWT